MKSKYVVCPVCHGEGKTMNPNIDAHGLTAEDFADDPERRPLPLPGNQGALSMIREPRFNSHADALRVECWVRDATTNLLCLDSVLEFVDGTTNEFARNLVREMNLSDGAALIVYSTRGTQ